MDGSLFYWLGGALVLAALGIAAIGIRGKASFPPNRAVMILGTAAFAAIVVGTSAYAVVNAQDEQEHRDKELAEEAAAAEQEATAEATPPPAPAGQPPAVKGGKQPAAPPAAATSLDVTSPSDGTLVFDPDGLEANAGSLTIAYSNPSPVPHSLAVENADGDVLGETQVFTGGEQDVTLDDLIAGEYVFFCTVPGHREAGMQGDLTVD